MAQALAPLKTIDQFFIRQQVEILEAITGFETQNKYVVYINQGQQLYFVGEKSDCCSRNCCGNLRSLDMRMFDNSGNHVINLNRPLACQACCYPCCLQFMEVSSPPGNVIGFIEQRWSILHPLLVVKNLAGDIMFHIKGPICLFRCGADVNFKILSPDKSYQIGVISKKWSGCCREALTDADNFVLLLPIDLDVKMKATLLGALFLIDMMYFENNEAIQGNLGECCMRGILETFC